MVRLIAIMAVLAMSVHFSGCMTTASPKAERITIVKDALLVVDRCKKLGTVSGHSNMGGIAGNNNAQVEVRESAAKLGADTILLQERVAGVTAITSGYYGIAYDCSHEVAATSVKKDAAVPSAASASDFKKAKLCQEKGGVWLNDSCQIELDESKGNLAH